MPLLYGEGSKAFTRLQHEIIRFSNDESIFAWTNPSPMLKYVGMLAESPADFVQSGDVCLMDFTGLGERSYSMTNLGLTIKLQCQVPSKYDGNNSDNIESMSWWTAPLACGRGRLDLQRAPIRLTVEEKEGRNFRVNLGIDNFTSWDKTRPQFFTKTLHVSEGPRSSRFKINRVLVDSTSHECLRRLRLRLSTRVNQEFHLTQIPRGFYEVPGANGGRQYFSSHFSKLMSCEMSRDSDKVSRLVFHGARNSTARLEVCWMKQVASVYNGCHDFKKEPCTIISPNQIREIISPRGALENDSPLTVTLREVFQSDLSRERIWLIEIAHPDSASSVGAA